MTPEELSGGPGRASGPTDNLAGLGMLAPLERGGSHTLEDQLAERLTDGIERGVLAHGTRLPSTREIAAALGLSRNLVAAAYAQLATKGLIVARHGSGTFVAPPRTNVKEGRRPEPPREGSWYQGTRGPLRPTPGRSAIDLRLRGGTLRPLPEAAWRRAWRSAVGDVAVGYEDPRGVLPLRAAVASFVAHHRGVACGADEVLITAGASDALRLLMIAVVDEHVTVAVEDPGYPTMLRLAESRRARVVRLPVDGDGAVVDDLRALPPGRVAVHLTPAHQFPLGVQLAQERREALLAWARERGALIIENDYDGEFGFSAVEPPALAAQDRTGTVVFVGTFSRLLTPGLRVGYVIAHPSVLDLVAHAKAEIDDHASTPVQRAVAALLCDGELDRHLRRVRRLAAYKRDRITRWLATSPGGLRLAGLQSGLHVVLEITDGPSPSELVERAAARQVLVERLGAYTSVAAPGSDRLLLDYGAIEPGQLDRGLAVLSTLLTP